MNRLQKDDRGAALITTMAIVAVISILTVTVASLGLDNLRNATRDKHSNSALATSEAGVAEAIEFIRSGTVGLSALTCPEPAAGATPSVLCTSNPLRWANPSNPMQVRVDGGVGNCLPSDTCYKVWIGTVTKYDPPGQLFGIYRIHSRGEFGNGPGVRSVVSEIKVKPYPFPIGVYGDSIQGNGTPAIRNESLFTTQCISHRDADSPDGTGGGGLKFNLSGVDLQYDKPPGAHSTNEIWSTTNCPGSGSSRPVHDTTAGPTSDCDPLRPNDQSMHGGPLVMGDGCRRMWTSPATGKIYDYPQTSKYTLDDLQEVGYRARGLSDAIYDVLESRARAAGTYWEGTTPPASVWTSLTALNGAQAVLYIKASGEVRINPTDIPDAYFRIENNSGVCTPSNLTIVVEGGGSGLSFGTAGGKTSGGKKLVAAMFVPDGAYVSNGNLPIIGSIFANVITMSGTTDFQLDQCFVDNPPSSVLDVKTQRFFEDDAY